MSIGTVKWFDYNKGYGFIEPEDNSPDVFVHITAVEKSNIRFLEEGAKVEYGVTSFKGKNQASDLKLLDK